MNPIKTKQAGSTHVVSINLSEKRVNLLANKAVILRVTRKQSYLSTFHIISFAFPFLFYFILLLWQLKDKTLIKILQHGLKIFVSVTHSIAQRQTKIRNFFVLMKILKY